MYYKSHRPQSLPLCLVQKTVSPDTAAVTHGDNRLITLIKLDSELFACEACFFIHLHELSPHAINRAILEMTGGPAIFLGQTFMDAGRGISQPHQHVETAVTLHDPIRQQKTLQLLLAVNQVQGLNPRAALIGQLAVDKEGALGREQVQQLSRHFSGDGIKSQLNLVLLDQFLQTVLPAFFGGHHHVLSPQSAQSVSLLLATHHVDQRHFLFLAELDKHLAQLRGSGCVHEAGARLAIVSGADSVQEAIGGVWVHEVTCSIGHFHIIRKWENAFESVDTGVLRIGPLALHIGDESHALTHTRVGIHASSRCHDNSRTFFSLCFGFEVPRDDVAPFAVVTRVDRSSNNLDEHLSTLGFAHVHGFHDKLGLGQIRGGLLEHNALVLSGYFST
mmetsp:Transcript_26182/g.49133  ORF Transcript_26182/g.49133 Transcript_26182/m.49133 type:complete len:390 (-) Transcript_26182:71-1240(-)